MAEGLHLALAQSSYLKLASMEGYFAAQRAAGEEDGPGSGGINAIRARSAARRMGAKAYLYGAS